MKSNWKWFAPWTWPAGYLLDSANHCQHCLNSVFFLYVSHVCIALNIQHIMQNTWGNYGIFWWKMLLLGYFSRRGVPSGKGYQKGPKKLIHELIILEPFSSQSEHRDPSKKTWNFRLSPKRPKSSTWAPRVPKRCPKGSILEVFLVPFQGPVPKVKTVLSLEPQPHLEGFRVP